MSAGTEPGQRSATEILAPLPGYDEIRIPLPAFRAAQQPCPINDRHSGAMVRDLRSDVGLGSVIADLAPSDDPNLSGEGLPQGQRSGLAFSARARHLSPMPMNLPSEAVPAGVPKDIRVQIVTPCKRPPTGDGWLHEIKHDGHRLVAILPGDGQLMLLSRNGYDRTRLFREPFRPLVDADLPSIVLDGEIAVPDHRGVTHLDAPSDAISERRPEQLAYFAFDLLHLDGHDLRRCPIEDRKMLLRDVIGAAGCQRIVYADHVLGMRNELFEAVRQIGAEGIVSKRRGSLYRGGESREWLKTKCSETGVFAITGFSELGDGKLDAVYVAEAREDVLCPAGQVRFFVNKGLWHVLDERRSGPANGGGIVPVWLGLVADIKFFGRHQGGSIRDGVICRCRKRRHSK